VCGLMCLKLFDIVLIKKKKFFFFVCFVCLTFKMKLKIELIISIKVLVALKCEFAGLMRLF
jgi:hypothetical protein